MPFVAMASRRALASGTSTNTKLVCEGSAVSPALATGHFHWVLVVADFGLSTPAVYAELDAHRARHVGDIAPAPTSPAVSNDVLQALRAGDAHMLANALHNDLQAPALQPHSVRLQRRRRLPPPESASSWRSVPSLYGSRVLLSFSHLFRRRSGTTLRSDGQNKLEYIQLTGSVLTRV
jgi:hypothetical protein